MCTKLQDTIDEMEKLGEKRVTLSEQRMMLVKISMRVNDILESAVKGYYENPFFGHVHMTAAVNSKDNIRRFRAVVQHLNLEFANDMRLYGHKFALGPGPGDEDAVKAEDEQALQELTDLADDEVPAFSPRPVILDRKEAISWVQKVHERSRGSELPGNYNPMLISQLFREQSSPWEQLASQHIQNVATACKVFVHQVLEHSAPTECLDRLTSLSVDTALAEALRECKDELKEIVSDKSRHPMTYNHYFTTTLQKQRQRKYQKITQHA
jgi:hypothetical protein